jgi:ABC-type bacteriocin/lantibiotic exporter with double-glycine peptidase domain
VDLNGSAGSLGDKLSGGQKQVVNLISGLVNPSKILILDEPTNALDPGLKQEIIKLIQEFGKRKSVIIISHDAAILPILKKEIKL